MRTPMRTLLLLSLVLFAVPAWAVDVYVNGERITGATNLLLRNPSAVRVDSLGNVHIDAPGYRIQAMPGTSAPSIPRAGATSRPDPTLRPDTPVLRQRYFLATESNAPGQVQYDIDVSINGRPFRRLREAEGRIIVEITDELRPGQNDIDLVATKDMSTARRSTSNGHVYRVMIGAGSDSGGGQITLRPDGLFVFEVDAAQIETVRRQRALFAQ